MGQKIRHYSHINIANESGKLNNELIAAGTVRCTKCKPLRMTKNAFQDYRAR